MDPHHYHRDDFFDAIHLARKARTNLNTFQFERAAGISMGRLQKAKRVSSLGTAILSRCLTVMKLSLKDYAQYVEQAYAHRTQTYPRKYEPPKPPARPWEDKVLFLDPEF